MDLTESAHRSAYATLSAPGVTSSSRASPGIIDHSALGSDFANPGYRVQHIMMMNIHQQV